MRSIRVLLTCLGGRFSLTVINALKQSVRPKIELIGADIDNNVTARHVVGSFHLIPRGSSVGYVPEVLRVCRKEKIDIFIPCADEEVIAVSKKKELFAKYGIACAVDNFETVDLVTDKWKLFNYLLKNDIPMPKFMLVDRIGDIKNAAEYLGYPKAKFILKPRCSRGARDTWIIGNDDGSASLDKLYGHLKKYRITKLNHVAVEFLPGDAYDVDLLSKNGRPIYIIPRRRIWKNKLSASTEGCIIERNDRLVDLVSAIARLLKLNYVYDFDCGSFGDSTPAIYEINPRFSGAVAASMGAGINIPLALVKMLIGSKITKQKIRYNVHMFPFTDMVFFE